MARVRVAACQINTVVGDLEGNARRILGALDEAERGRADLAVFPELAVTGYPPEDLLGRPAFVTDNRAVFAEIAASTGTCAAVVGYVDTDRAGRLVNAAAMCAGGRVVGRYFKRLLPNYGVFDEQRWSVPGGEPPLLVEDPVVGQQALEVSADHAATCAHGRGIDQSPGPIGVDVPDHGRTGARGRGDLGEHRPVVGHEGRPAQEILGRVPGDRQFGEDGQVRTAALCLVEGTEDAPGIALEVAHHGVDLARGHPHSSHGASLSAPQTDPLWTKWPPTGVRLRQRGPQGGLFIVRSQSGNGGETAPCDSGLSLGFPPSTGMAPGRRRRYVPRISGG